MRAESELYSVDWLWHQRRLLALAILVGLIFTSQYSSAELLRRELSRFPISTSTESSEPQNGDLVESYQIGFANHVRLGHWTHASLKIKNSDLARSIRQIEISCPDGDDLPINYRQPATCNELGIVEGYFRLGRPVGEIGVRLLNENGDTLCAMNFAVGVVAEEIKSVRATARIIVGVGDVPEFRRGAEIQDAYDTDLATFLLKAFPVEFLPNDHRGYRGVDTVILAVSNRELLEQISASQLDALAAWVERGGKLMMWMAADLSSEISKDGRLGRLGNFDNVRTFALRRLSVVERFVDATVPLPSEPPVSLIDVGEKVSQPVLSQDGRVLAGRYRLGMGTVMFVSLPLCDEPLKQWLYTPVLLEKLINSDVTVSDSGTALGAGMLIDNGYRDLSGQFRVPLEAFSTVQLVPFTLVAALIVLFLLLVGPGDFFLLRSAREKMHWTWLTFPLFVALFCGVAYWINQSFKDSTLRVNVCEVIDVEPTNSQVTGRVWAGIYSPQAESFNLEVNSNRTEWSSPSRRELTWMGHPGSGLGGMQTTTPSFAPPTAYHSVTDNGQSNQNLALEGFPITFASTKTVSGYFEATGKTRNNSRLVRTRRLDRLDGQVGNPFDFTLYNPRLFYGESVFTPEKHLAPGDAVDVFTEMKERTIKHYFAGRSGDATKEGSKAQKWNPQETNSHRILLLSMVHDLVGGQRYSGLSNRYLEGIELSDHLLPDRAVLVGEVHEPMSQILINGRADRTVEAQRTTLIRVFLPVEIERTRAESKAE
ncbi:MAG: hypothetical protein KF851_19445 [Pirellulaceae bacterium]|nr:hypothetical protein [Pirellulaceae bacterium]